MSKTKQNTQYVCTECGADAIRWQGQCPSCKAWNTLKEFKQPKINPQNKILQAAGYAGISDSKIQNLSEIALIDIPRIESGFDEFDRVLGGGLVPGSVILVGGDPGIGKSSLLLQIMGYLAQSQKVLYVTGEESAEQVAMRAKRMELGIDNKDSKGIHILTDVIIEEILSKANQFSPQFMVVDSIQTMQLAAIPSAPGSVTQVRESAALLTRYAKQTGTCLLIVGHVTKTGEVAGPKVLEHIVDAVVYLEGEQSSRYRTARALKNRFGSVNELGIFAMTETGMKAVKNPSAIFLSSTTLNKPGSIVTVLWEGSRPILIELQALVDQSAGGHPRRVCLGVDPNRVNMLLAVLSRHAGVTTYDQDVYLNVVGGVKAAETSADLAVILAILSSLKGRAFASNQTLAFGEVGLSGELRPVKSGIERVMEAEKHGFERVIIPMGNMPKASQLKNKKIKVLGANTLQEAIDLTF